VPSRTSPQLGTRNTSASALSPPGRSWAEPEPGKALVMENPWKVLEKRDVVLGMLPQWVHGLKQQVNVTARWNELLQVLNRFTMKKRSEEMQTLRAGCSKAEPKFSPGRRPPSRGAWDGQNLISWRCMVTTFIYRPSLVRINSGNFELLW